MKDGELVKMIVGDKVWQVTRKMAKATIEIAKKKYEKEGVHAIVGVEKDGIISLAKDTYDNETAFDEAIKNWEHGGYICYYTK